MSNYHLKLKTHQSIRQFDIINNIELPKLN